MPLIKNCLNCEKEFSCKPCHDDRAKYCSRECKYEFSKGKHYSPKTEFVSGQTVPKKCWYCNEEFHVIPSKSDAKYCSQKCYQIARVGRKHSDKTREKMAKTQLGENHWNWKGGVTAENQKLRSSIQYKNWRRAVFKKDKDTCQWCGSKENLQADHIRPWSENIETRFAVWNGRVLCEDCHKKTRDYCGRTRRALNPKISMVIPCYTLNEELEEMAIHCAASYRSQVDEMIIIEDGGRSSKTLANIADIYYYHKENLGFTKNVNAGWSLSTGDYTMIVSSDTFLLHNGNLNELCLPGVVSSPHITNQSIERLAGPFFVVPKEIKEERGMLLEEMKIYCSDSEYDHRVKDIFQKVPTVKVFHKMMQTVGPAGVEGHEQQQRDRLVYQKLIMEGRACG